MRPACQEYYILGIYGNWFRKTTHLSSFCLSLDLGSQLSNTGAAIRKCIGSTSVEEEGRSRRPNVACWNRPTTRAESYSHLSRIIWRADAISKSGLCFAEWDSRRATQTKGTIICSSQGISKEAKSPRHRTGITRGSFRLCIPLKARSSVSGKKVSVFWFMNNLCCSGFSMDVQILKFLNTSIFISLNASVSLSAQ